MIIATTGYVISYCFFPKSLRASKDFKMLTLDVEHVVKVLVFDFQTMFIMVNLFIPNSDILYVNLKLEI